LSVLACRNASGLYYNLFQLNAKFLLFDDVGRPRCGLKEFSVNQDIVSGHDENDGDLTDGKYKVSVRFKAAIVK
jgi:hypothetical protein